MKEDFMYTEKYIAYDNMQKGCLLYNDILYVLCFIIWNLKGDI